MMRLPHHQASHVIPAAGVVSGAAVTLVYRGLLLRDITYSLARVRQGNIFSHLFPPLQAGNEFPYETVIEALPWGILFIFL
jgi:hypothetical protein